MAPVEVVVDGTNFGGKTPLVERLVARMQAGGVRVETASPYREREVYPLWDTDPVAAARAVRDLMQARRERAACADVIVWDRGWPTCFISTRDPVARRLFLPLPPLTYVLLNTAAATEKKVRKYGLTEGAVPWMHRRRLRDEISYEELTRRFPDELRAFEPTLDDDRFDLELVSTEILLEVGRALGPRPP